MIFRPLTREWWATGSPRRAVAARSPARTRVLVAAAAAALAAVLFPVYERLSATAAITADSANAVLQGQAIAGGNLLLHGWTLSGASFFVTDLPFYAVAASVRGLSPAVAHDVGAAIYTLLVVAACLLARGRATGLDAVARMAVTLALLLAPASGAPVELLLLGPFHAGTALTLIAALLMLDAAGERVAGAVVVGALLALAVLSDALALYVGVAPIVVVAILRLASGQGPRRPDQALLGAAVLAVPVSLVLGWTLSQVGGFMTVPLDGSFATIESLPRNAALTVEGALLLFGANFFGQPVARVGTLGILVHLVGFGFVVAAFGSAVRTWRRGEQIERLTQVLVVGMTVDVGAYLFSNEAIDLRTSRYLIPFLVYGAVLAGRVGGRWLGDVRVRAGAAVAAAAYAALLGVALATPPAPPPDRQLATFLARNHLTYGVAAYWQASTTTVDTRGAIRVRAVDLNEDPPTPYRWEAQTAWYDPAVPGNDARFALLDTSDRRSLDRGAAEAAFGPATRVYHVGHYEVLVWDRNLLNSLNR
ncbi:MAG TPA: hypothetical protein VKF59_18435 [Candidatus Dormibacteraeota bacterium]|nr:hypothetical protein [Candidatus Dormibacteraeota bacterium]